MPALQARDGGLAGAHTCGEFRLREPGAQTRADQFGGNLEFRRQRVVFGLYLGIGQQTSLELLEWDGHTISLARRSASSISARGVRLRFLGRCPDYNDSST